VLVYIFHKQYNPAAVGADGAGRERRELSVEHLERLAGRICLRPGVMAGGTVKEA
jgi:hypothetical protein